MAGYLKQCFQELHQEDGLVVMAAGLGLRQLLAKFLHLHSRPADKEGRRRLVFVLNASNEEQLLLDALLGEGLEPEQLPQVITSKNVSSAQRQDMYKRGGCFIVTSRILIVDLLHDAVEARAIAGILVHNAHRVTETCTEAFILHVFRLKNSLGFVKAFSDEPEALIRGFHKVEKVLKSLTVTKLFLWPRFQVNVTNCLQGQSPHVQELRLDLTPLMKDIQEAVAVAIDDCLGELKKAAPFLDVSDLTIENSIFKAFDQSIKYQLLPQWHQIPSRTKQLVDDLKTFRKLLDYLVGLDAVNFYHCLLIIRSTNTALPSPSGWLSTHAADRLFAAAKARVYRVCEVESGDGKRKGKKTGKDKKGKSASGKKQRNASKEGGEDDVELCEEQDEEEDEEDEEDGDTEGASGTVAEGGGGVAGVKAEKGLAKRCANLRVELVLEETPKWAVLQDLLKEVERDYYAKAERDMMKRRGRRKKSKVNASASGEAAAAEEESNSDDDEDEDEYDQCGGAAGIIDGARVLVMVNDRRTASQLRQVLTLPGGGRDVMLRQFFPFLRCVNERGRRVREAATQSKRNKKNWRYKNRKGKAANAANGKGADGGDGGGGDGLKSVVDQLREQQRKSGGGGSGSDVVAGEGGGGGRGDKDKVIIVIDGDDDGGHSEGGTSSGDDGGDDGGGSSAPGGGSGVQRAMTTTASTASATSSTSAAPTSTATSPATAVATKGVTNPYLSSPSLSTSGRGLPSRSTTTPTVVNPYASSVAGGSTRVARSHSDVPPSSARTGRMAPNPYARPLGKAGGGAGGGVLGGRFGGGESGKVLSAAVESELLKREEGRLIAEFGFALPSGAGAAKGGAGKGAGRKGTKRRREVGADEVDVDVSMEVERLLNAEELEGDDADLDGNDGDDGKQQKGKGKGKAKGKPGKGKGNAATTASGARGDQQRKRMKAETGSSSAGGGGSGAAAAAGHGESPSGPEKTFVFELLSPLHVVVQTYDEAKKSLSILEELQPEYILLYDMDKEFVRAIELHFAMRQRERGRHRSRLTVYFLSYSDSVELKRYELSIAREKEAFTKLIELKSHMVVGKDPALLGIPPPLTGNELSMDTRTGRRELLETSGAGGGISGQGGSAPSSQLQGISGVYNSRMGGGRRGKKPVDTTVVVDVREMRSSLPMLLYQRGLNCVVETIAVGDYIISRDICVERKSVSDLYGSFISGRLFTQAEAMTMHYRTPTLLVEFAADRAFGLQSKSALTADLSVNNIVSKIALLVMHVPTLRILWSRSPHATVEMFEALKAKCSSHVDVAMAKQIGKDAPLHSDEDDDSGVIGVEAEAADADEPSGVNDVAREMLMRLPGITRNNYFAVMKRVNSIAELSRLSEEEMKAVVGSTAAAKKLYEFFNAEGAV